MQMRYKEIIKAVPICAWLTLVMLVAALWLAPPSGFADWLFFSLALMITATWVAWLSFEVFRSRIDLRADGLTVTKNFKRSRHLQWHEIEHVDYHVLWSAFIVTPTRGQKFYVATTMTNLKGFISALAAAVERERYIGAIEKFAKSFGQSDGQKTDD